jgi:hypothetical protein
LNKNKDIDFCDASIDMFLNEKEKDLIITAKSEEQNSNADDLSKSTIIK